MNSTFYKAGVLVVVLSLAIIGILQIVQIKESRMLRTDIKAEIEITNYYLMLAKTEDDRFSVPYSQLTPGFYRVVRYINVYDRTALVEVSLPHSNVMIIVREIADGLEREMTFQIL